MHTGHWGPLLYTIGTGLAMFRHGIPTWQTGCVCVKEEKQWEEGDMGTGDPSKAVLSHPAQYHFTGKQPR